MGKPLTLNLSASFLLDVASMVPTAILSVSRTGGGGGGGVRLVVGVRVKG